MIQGINTAHNTEKHWRNLVHADAEQVANRITVDKDDDDVDTNKEDDAVPMVNQDEGPMDPFGDRDDWAIGIMSKASLKVGHVL